jgi:hypothetical protein
VSAANQIPPLSGGGKSAEVIVVGKMSRGRRNARLNSKPEDCLRSTQAMPVCSFLLRKLGMEEVDKSTARCPRSARAMPVCSFLLRKLGMQEVGKPTARSAR